ncbi:hypothetical protein K491DRAFT_599778 [Lophiostoma macrostomum CBS 122681]|uniref:S-adenosyl-L-methionine-dependent methyltransferase n=1 Tax=Lophiostoma macrostomum CBS 122681 TaxID=1314788 RepID=A0A6A6T7M7_9PLEO|nr:hypothetical protein K491DRAFT_599778 [Lophiostoma macrostomum CBS 122681]
MLSQGRCLVLILFVSCALTAVLAKLGVTFPFRLPSISHTFTFLCGLLTVPFLKYAFTKSSRAKEDAGNDGSRPSVYGLDHGRLHVELPLPMWMNMGYWYEHPHNLATACRTLLSEVLTTAGFDRKRDSTEVHRGIRRTKALIDLGFGCGDQTIYIKSQIPMRKFDQEWFDNRNAVVIFDHYIGITQDRRQFQYAEPRVSELKQYRSHKPNHPREQAVKNTHIYCGNAADPEAWDSIINPHVLKGFSQAEERWVLALDSLYHFSPSRWGTIRHARSLNASLMAFDLCIADHVSLPDLILLRILTMLMGAPWANFVTQTEYHNKLREVGYTEITMRDVSEHVFGPLAEFMEAQNRVLNVIGYGLGAFHAARLMFGWWARSGVVRGVIVVAR